MDKIIVVSSNNNPDYLFYARYAEHTWNKFGWRFAVCITTDVNPLDLKLENSNSIIIGLPKLKRLRSETIAQGGRLYAANFLSEDALIMTCDMDLIPLSNYWHPKIEDITIYGHDLTWHSYYPMGYIAMSGANWKKYMRLTGLTESDFERDAEETQIALKPDWESWWNYDWDLITKRLKPYEKQLTFIDRGQINIAGATLALGRVDRYNWEKTQEQPDWIDAHCHNTSVTNPERLESFLKVYEKIHGKL